MQLQAFGAPHTCAPAHLPAPLARAPPPRSPSARGEATHGRDGVGVWKGLTGPFGTVGRGRSVFRGPAARVAGSRFSQVVLEAHLPRLAAAAEAPQAAGRAPQQPAALPGERGQVVHAASRRHGSLGRGRRETAPAQPADPGAAAPRLQATGAGQASSGPGRTIGRRVGGERTHKVPEKFCLSPPHREPGRA